MKNWKQNNFIVAVVLSLLIAATTYYLTEDYFIALAVLAISAFAINTFAVNVLVQIKQYQEKIAIAHQIIHAIAVDISVRKSVYSSIAALQEHLPEKYQELLTTHNNDYLKGLQEIAQELQIVQFHVFCKILQLYETQGGEAGGMNFMLLSNIDNLKIKTDKLVRDKKGRTKEIIMMWFLSFAILLYMRLGLQQFYFASLNNYYFRYAIGAAIIIGVVAVCRLFQMLKNINLERGEIK